MVYLPYLVVLNGGSVETAWRISSLEAPDVWFKVAALYLTNHSYLSAQAPSPTPYSYNLIGQYTEADFGRDMVTFVRIKSLYIFCLT